MENLTHSLVGLLCAEIVVRARERRRAISAWSRTALYATAIIGNNLPDLDFTYSHISGERFGYLLQHRGYTHTLAAAFGFAIATLGALFALAKWRGVRISAAEWRLLALLALLSPLLHIAMDFSNDYGVHPFWPLNERWFYGDSIFILEPSFWLVLLAPLLFSYRSKLVRSALGLVLAVALGAVWYRPFVPARNAVVLTLLTVALLAVARSRTPFLRMLIAAGGFVLVLTLFVFCGRVAKSRVRERAAQAFPDAVTLDVVATPMPANPWCWKVLVVQRDAEQYFVRVGRVAVWPIWLDAQSCPYDRAANPTAPLRPIHAIADPGLVLSAEYRIPIATLRVLLGTRCEVQAFVRFARVPYIGPIQADGSRVLGDLRYDRNPGLDFSDVPLGPGQSQCPQYMPRWRPPRSDLLF
ncbi:MAG: metal-dependent hydrolase [Pseudomonadota bacterium]